VGDEQLMDEEKREQNHHGGHQTRQDKKILCGLVLNVEIV
jgi:hypothetical protein